MGLIYLLILVANTVMDIYYVDSVNEMNLMLKNIKILNDINSKLS